MLPKEWSKRLVDTNVRELSKDDLDWADCAFISAMVVQRGSAHQIIAQCKEAGLLVVAGGPLFQIEHEQFPLVDHFVLNEAELTLPPFLADWEKGCPQRLYSSELFPDLRLTPLPMWDLLDMEKYATMCVQSSRGCPFDCDFCNITALFGRRFRVKPSRQILAELNGLYERGWRGAVFFVDDNFIGNKHYLKTDLLPALMAWRKTHRGIGFNTETSINLAEDEQLMTLMVEAGFDTVFIGIETPDEDCLAECSKVQNRNRDLVDDVKRMQRAGLQVQGGFIVGFDHDSPSIFQRQIDFIQKSGIVTAMVGLLQAPPGTRLYERMKKEGRLRGEMSGDNVDGTTNIAPVMSLEALYEGYRKILEHIYAPKYYYQRIRTFLREFKAPTIRPHVQWGHIRAVLHATYRLGILGSERFQYWKLMLWTQFHRPRLIPEAIKLAIYGYHFRKVSEQCARSPSIK